jgi:phage-related tail fiber protein
MIDSNSQFYAILTNVGVAKQANANALGIAWKITHMGVGDAYDTDPQPSATQKTLINEWRRAPLNQLIQDATNPAIIIAEQVIPAEVGGKWIREIGLYDADGDLVAIANCAPSFKPLLAQGSGRTQVVRMNLIVSNSASVELKIDPAVVLATREFVTSELAKQDFKSSVLVCTPGNITLSGLQTIDGVAVTAGKRVLVAKQTAAKDNGIWVAAAGAWARAADADKSERVTAGLLVHVEQGTLYGDSGWQLVTDGALSLGVTSLSFEMAWGRTGVAAGTYRSVTVDKYGRVVAATNPTTVVGYGLTDVYTMTQVDTALGLKADLNSPVLTGIPKAPTAAPGTNTQQVATTAFIQAALVALVNSSPTTLDTLNELAAALGNDANFATTMANALGLKAPIASPTFTGVPKAPTATVGTASSQVATMQAIIDALANIGLGLNLSMGANAIASTTDLNTITVSGLYGQSQNVSATLVLNYPVAGKAGTLLVQRGGSEIVTQLYTEYNTGRIWSRGIYKDVPSAWSMLWDTTTLVKTTSPIDATAGRMLKVGDFGVGATTLSASVTIPNIDDVTMPNGLYPVGTSTAAGTKPATYGIVEVIGRSNVVGSLGRVHQTFYDPDVAAKMWTRAYLPASSSWTPWARQWDESNLVKTTSPLDSTPGSMLKVGDFGLGLKAVGLDTTSIDALSQTGFYAAKINVTPGTWPSGATLCDMAGPTIINIIADDGPSRTQYLMDRDANTTYYRAMSSGTWKPWQRIATNNDLQGVLTKSVAGGVNVTLTAAEAAYGVLWFTGALTANISVIVPAGIGMWTVVNRTTGAFTLTIRQGAVGNPGVVIPPSRQIQVVSNGTTTLTQTNTAFVSAEFSNEIQATGINALRHIQGDYASFWRNDGASLYLMLTNSGDQYGTYNALRPFAVAMATGKVSLAAGVNMPTMPPGTNTTDGATCGFVQAAVAALVDSSPATLNTLNELAEALGDDPNFATSMANALGLKAPLASPSFTGDPKVPTPATGDKDTSAANTAFVHNTLESFGMGGGTAVQVSGAATPTDIAALPAGNYYFPPGVSPYPDFAFAQRMKYLATRGFELANIPYTDRFFGRASNNDGTWRTPVELAKLDSPAFTGTPTVPTPAAGDNSSKAANTAFVQAAMAANVGEVTHFAMSTPPPGYLKRNGAWVSRTAYAALFAKIGTTYGAGDGSTSFTLPDSRADFDRGWDDGRNVDTGRVFGSAQASQNLNHNHTGTVMTGGAHNHTATFVRERITAERVYEGGNSVVGDEMTDGTQGITTSDHPGHTHGLAIGYTGGNESRPVNTAFLACIKY